MNRRRQLRDLVAEPFLREIHRLLWLDAGLLEDARDLGWSCREHAWVASLLAHRMGHAPLIVHGRAYYYSAASATRGAIEFSQNPHSWIVVDDAGAVDISLRRDLRTFGRTIRYPVRCVYAGAGLPRGRGTVAVFDDGNAFDHAVERLAQSGAGTLCAYHAANSEHLHEGLLRHAADWIGSYLTQWLEKRYGEPSLLYAAMLRHVCAVWDGDGKPLADRTFEQAWDAIAENRDGAMAWSLKAFALPVVLHQPEGTARADHGAPRVESDGGAPDTQRVA